MVYPKGLCETIRLSILGEAANQDVSKISWRQECGAAEVSSRCFATAQGRPGRFVAPVPGQVTTFRSQGGGSATNVKSIDFDLDRKLNADIATPCFAMG